MLGTFAEILQNNYGLMKEKIQNCTIMLMVLIVVLMICVVWQEEEQLKNIEINWVTESTFVEVYSR